MTTSLESWAPPPGGLDYTRDCSALARFISDVTAASNSRSWTVSWAWTSTTLEAIEDMVRGALPPDYTYPGSTRWDKQPDTELILTWFVSDGVNNTFKVTNAETWKPRCEEEVCSVIGFNGNSDLIGEGVIISYLIEAIMVTMYCLAAAAFMWLGPSTRRRRQSPAHPAPPTRRTRSSEWNARSSLERALFAFRGTITDFKRSAAILALAMSIAGFVVILDPAPTPFERTIATMVSLFAVFAVMVLSVLETWTTRRRSKLSAALCAFFLALIGSEMIVCKVIDGQRDGSESPQFSYGARECLGDVRFLMSRLNKAVMFLGIIFLVVMVVGVLVWTINQVLSSRETKRPAFSRPQHSVMVRSDSGPSRVESALLRITRFMHGRGAGIAAMVLSLCIMYFALVLTVLIKSLLRYSTGSQQWTFGQVLAVGTWAPVLAEWFYLFFFGMKTGLEGRMPYEYEALYVGKDDAAREQPVLVVDYEHKKEAQQPTSDVV
ncbi:hypothetical protein B0H66DRAFT_643180 [Apodospora peruviana]|uniref:Uncharacterized protein n=1 Tax=Apodospora peruviana TaxID=516989 RepID=A0AAE0HX90_9PEZI|nr:hypothetical protein B0H66DRAFT_643180 [Apodospora peruviana]